jgi:hypothetical protein
LLAEEGVAETKEAEVSCSMGEYVNLGYCRLVSLAVLFSTAFTELDSAEEATEEGVGIGLLSAVFCLGSNVLADVGTALEASSVVGFGEGVMKDVEKTVCGSWVTSGSPSGLTKVMAGAIDVKIVR